MQVSIYRNVYDNIGLSGDLFDFLTTDKWKKLSDKIRREKDTTIRNKLKLQLPACTPSGLFEERRKDKLIKHSGYICIDIDNGDNQKIKDWPAFITWLGKLLHVAFAGLSVSGNGAFVLFKIANTHQHYRHFKAIEEDFLKHGIIVDPACKDVARLRIYSYNAHPYINPNAKTYTKLYEKQHRQQKYYLYNHTNVEKLVDRLVDEIVETQTNIVPNYESWFKVGAALSTIRNGRAYFHAISSVDTSKYNFKKCDKQFDKCMRFTEIKINTFFYYAKINGILLK